ncbi:alpha/beta fold hydrolase [candidate division CSSED10-310 bacterium]|uniref:Alpha/beta fold hydrolase n=1 Tax=candidate division CSSED10-310 bacterium TaxID=2855610 RepID=A0ABV6YRS0_UNCC1
MSKIRKYGQAPYQVAVVHGGPGAGGEMAPVARRLASHSGVLEPFQTALSLPGQIEELRGALQENGNLPLILIGYSWGAWLSFIIAARYPSLVEKLILISSGPFSEKYAARIQETRLSRLDQSERTELESLLEIINNPTIKDKNRAFARFGDLFSKTDTFNPLTSDAKSTDTIEFRADIFHKLWPQGAALRSSGELLEFGKDINCPVIAIHGDYDPHPADGVREPLTTILKNFRFVQLQHCGHKPWGEQEARESFFRILAAELD